MKYAVAMQKSNTRFVNYSTTNKRHYFRVADGYVWELVDGKLVPIQHPPRMMLDRWEPITADEAIYDDLKRAYEAVTPPSIPEPKSETNGRRVGLIELTNQVDALFEEARRTLEKAADHAYNEPEFAQLLDHVADRISAIKATL